MPDLLIVRLRIIMDPGRDCGARQCCTCISHVPERGKDVMRDAVTTIGKLTDRQSVVFISSVDEDGFPNTKAMLAPRKREGIKVFYFHTNTSSMRVRQYKSLSLIHI